MIKEAKNLDIWHSDLAIIQRRIGSDDSPRLKILPEYWPLKFGAGWSFLNYILIAPWVLHVDKDVRNFLLSHEYGHVYNRHSMKSLPVFLFIVASLVICWNLYADWLSYFPFFTSFIMLVATRKADEKEYQADDFALKMLDKEVVLKGIKRIGEITGSSNDKKRLARIKRIKLLPILIFMSVVLNYWCVLGEASPLSVETGNSLRFQIASELKVTESLSEPRKAGFENQYFSVIYGHICSTAPRLGTEWADWLAQTIIYYSDKWQVDPLLVTALFTQESGFNMSSLSKTGAIGIAQLMPSTARMLGVKADDAEGNIEGGIRYLAEQLDRFRDAGDWTTSFAIAAYNAGPEAVRNHKGIPPYDETINHVNQVSSIYMRLLHAYENG